MKRSEIIKGVMESDARKIKYTYEQLDFEAFDEAVKIIGRARNIYVAGLRSCAPLASYLAFHLNLIAPGVHLLTTNSASELFEQMLHIGERDVLIAVSFPRYSMRTLKATEFANQRKAKVITITDEEHSPINLYSSCKLIARSEMTDISDSLVAPMSLVNALVVALCRNRKKKVVENLESLEEIWEDYQIYGPDELNPLEENPEVKIVEDEDDKSSDCRRRRSRNAGCGLCGPSGNKSRCLRTE